MSEKLYWTQYKNPPKICQSAECHAPVTNAVPFAPNRLRDYIWLCRPCARRHNENWNYKQGKTDAEIEQIIQDDMHWNRTTRPMADTQNLPYIAQGLEHAISDLMGTKLPTLYPLPESVQQAYATLELSAPLSADDLKLHYKKMVKKYHPDTGKNPSDDRIKKINVAYDTITEYINTA